MIRVCFMAVLVLGWVGVSADAQLFKKIDGTKVSDFSGKQFDTKSTSTREFETKPYDNPKSSYATKDYSTHEFSQSSKNYSTSMAQFRPRGVATPEVPAKSFDKREKEYSTKSYDTKDVPLPGPISRIADKPVTDWQTLIRKNSPSGLPGKFNDVPFSRWKAVDDDEKK